MRATLLGLASTLLACGADTPPAILCQDAPAHDPALARSSAAAVSHAAGADCLACHTAGGGARTAFLVAGTIYAAGDRRELAAAGSAIDDVGQTTLRVDACGNIYAVAAALNGVLAASQPRAGATTMRISTDQPGRRMGGCNAAGCHDFVEAWGVHF